MLSQRELEVLSQIRVTWCELGRLLEEYSDILARRMASGEPVERGLNRAVLNKLGELVLNGRSAKECE